MIKKKLNELVLASYDGEDLDEKSVQMIADRLNRNILKRYISLIKQEEKKKMIFVTTPKPLTDKEREKIKSLFPKKKIIEQIDPAMIAGIRIVKNDEAYEMDLNQTFHDIIRSVSNND
ncbi:MAG TPA: F0F1 ATP synthase subunit delta [Candidatus Saccharimonadales bacterium]|nr:F0F1 ATP synthase subunit delta [Candidatus Saccharimonadales bacterium]